MTQTATVRGTRKSPAVLTPGQEARNRRDASLYREYVQLLTEEPGRSVTMLNEYLKERYGFLSMSGYYDALKRGKGLSGKY